MSTLYGSRSYLARVGPPTRREDVLRHRLLGYERRLSFLPGFDWLAGAGDRSVALRVSDTLSLAAAVRAGLGLAVLPIFVGDRDSELVRIACVEPEVETIWLVTPTELRRTRAVRAAMDFMAELFRSHREALCGKKANLR